MEKLRGFMELIYMNEITATKIYMGELELENFFRFKNFFTA